MILLALMRGLWSVDSSDAWLVAGPIEVLEPWDVWWVILNEDQHECFSLQVATDEHTESLQVYMSSDAGISLKATSLTHPTSAS